MFIGDSPGQFPGRFVWANCNAMSRHCAFTVSGNLFQNRRGTAAIEQIEQTFQISKEDALVIREVCEEVSEKEEIKTTVLNNRKDSLFLENYEPTVHGEVTTSYIERELWDKIDSPIYNDKGGIFAIMSKAVIQNIVSI